MAVNAAKGQHRAQRLFSELLSSTVRSRKALHDEWFATALTYKLDWQHELDRRVKHGIKNLPEPLPHPDQISINMQAGTAKVVGPMTRDAKAMVDGWSARKVEIADNVEGLKQNLKMENDPDGRVDILKHIDIAEELLVKIRRAIPD